jgi:eukaryotic-like serine/threonine-protein kinase
VSAGTQRHQHWRRILGTICRTGELVLDSLVSRIARKYVRRRAAGVVAVVTGAMVLLVALAVMQAVELRRITRERDRADRITEFMTSMFKVSDPSEARGNTITAREILDKSSKEIDTGLARDPGLKAQMMQVMGTVYESQASTDRPSRLYNRPQRSAGKVLDEKTPPPWILLVNWPGLLARREIDMSKPRKWTKNWSRRRIARLVRMIGSRLRPSPICPDCWDWLLGLAGRYAEAETLCRHVTERQRQILGTDNPETLESERRMALILVQEGHFTEADTLLRRNLAIRRGVFAPEDPKSLVVMDDLASVLTEEEFYEQAEQLYRQTLDARTRFLGLDHPDTLETMGNLATVFDIRSAMRSPKNCSVMSLPDADVFLVLIIRSRPLLFTILPMSCTKSADTPKPRLLCAKQ